MSERKPTRKPTVIIGSTVASGGGSVNTGQLLYSLGGARTYSVMSGTAGGDVNVQVGGGRLDKVNVHWSTIPAASGVPIVFYDSAVAVSGGPLSSSGHKVIQMVKHPNNPNVSGLIHTPFTVDVGFVYSSGLCVTGASGMVGFSVSYTPTVSGEQNNG